jgi:hypothetical protein
LDSPTFRVEVARILKTDIKFDGHVDLVIENLEEERQRAILEWVDASYHGREIATPCRNKALLCFIYKSSDNRIRGILTKEKNSYFIELFLDKHKYYDRKRKFLGL